ncbi:DUF2306 domain-containing protein [Microbispora triticiradicis]|uniref:DUF2306 domain-containing protein n=1 Tax=Microbispora triticiradicis TaxID=2200763 RepID=A0ABX9LP21_9ACTN|nr:DUF2306 domain-containing protein [Microbispora triticiradicis]
MTELTSTRRSVPTRGGRRKREWLVPAGLIALSAVPVVAGATRLSQLTGGGPVTANSARYFATPFPVVAHIVAVTLFSLLGALQFAPALRRRAPRWHRISGRVLVPAGLVTALSGLWMTLFYPHLPDDSALLVGVRLVVGGGMIVSIVLGFAAIRRRDVARHRAWMARGYALGMGAGTQVLTIMPWVVLTGGQPGPLPRALLMALAWVINLAVTEWAVRPRPGARKPGARRPAPVSP